MSLWRKSDSTELVPIDDVVSNLPFIVRRDHRIAAAFAKQSHAVDWAQTRSFDDESRFTIHTASKVIDIFQDGNSQINSD
jgi:hypothetical protein